MTSIMVIAVQRMAVTRRAAAKLYLSDRVSGSPDRIAMREVATKLGTMSNPITTPRMICESTTFGRPTITVSTPCVTACPVSKFIQQFLQLYFNLQKDRF